MGGALLITTVLIPIIQETILMSTPTPVLTLTPVLRSELPPVSPGVSQQQLGQLPGLLQEFGKQNECSYNDPGRSEKYWVSHIGAIEMNLIEDYVPLLNLSTFDLDNDGRPEILKWDLGRDGWFDIIECDVDGDGVLDYAIGDLNSNGEVDIDEIYPYHDAASRWQLSVPGALPLPILPVLPN